MATTAQRLRTFWEERNGETTGLVSLAVRYWPIAITVAFITLGAILRLWDLGGRAIHHDESIHIKFAWDITKNGLKIYTHDPVYHGPFQYFAIATSFKLFGDNEYTSRLAAATFGILLLGLPWLLRRQLGLLGAIVATGLLAVSPVILYVSRFAREDMYVIFFTLAMAVCIWRYLADRPADEEGFAPPPQGGAALREQLDGAIEYLGRPHHLWLIAIGPLMALSFATKEITPITMAIFIIFINFMVAWDLIDQYRESRTLTARELVIAYAGFVSTAWAIVALWPFTEEWRKRLSLERFPAAGALLIIFGTLAAPQFSAVLQLLPTGVSKIPLIGDSLVSGFHIDGLGDAGYMREHGVMQFTVLVLIFGSAFVGLFWNWRVWLAAALLFFVPFVVLFTSFFTNMPGFWTGIWGSTDYWLSQQGVERGGQPDYYYLMLTPVYEFLPLIFGLGGTLYYAFRGRPEQKLLVASALLLIFILSIIPGESPIIGGVHIHLAFLVAIATVLMLRMDAFTKFLIYWTLAIFFGVTIAGERMPWLTVHIALPLAILAARIINNALSSFPEAARRAMEPERKTRGSKHAPEGESMSWLRSPWVLLGATAAFALFAALIFQAKGPASSMGVIAWMLSAGAAICVFWLASRVSLQAAGQVAMVGLFSAMLVFTVRAASFAAYDQGDVDGYPQELLIYSQGSPKLGVVANEIDRIAEVSGKGYDLKIYIDNTGNTWPLPWYLRDYRNVQYTTYDSVVPEPGSVVLIQEQNRGKIEPYADQYQDPVAYTHLWWFLPQFYLGLDQTDFLGDVMTGHYWGIWRDYFIDRTVPGATPGSEMLAYFPSEFPSNVPAGQQPPPPTGPVPVSATGQALSPDVIETIAELGSTEGAVNQPAGVTTDNDGNVYIIDRLNHRVEKFAPDGTVSSFGKKGNDTGQFGDPYSKGEYENHDGPWGIAVDSAGNIYVADTWNGRIQKFGPDFEFIMAWGSGELFGPRDIALDGNGNLFVVDTGNKRVVEYTTDGVFVTSHDKKDANGVFVEGTGPGEFSEPSSISVAPNGDIYVADYWNQRIQHFDSDFQYIDEIAMPSWGSHGITDRAYIVALDRGRVLATDPANGRIAVVGADGKELGSWRIADPSIPSRPIGIAWDGGGNVYISDALISDEQPIENDDVSGALVRVPLSALMAQGSALTATP